MKFDEYQEKAKSTAIYKVTEGEVPTYPFFGLAEEAGEVLGKMAKYTRDGWPIDKLREEVRKELGDVLWNVANIAADLGLSLEDIAEGNIQKLKERKERGVLQGSGDNR